MIKLIFEDNPDSAISYLLLRCYNKDSIIFSSGNGLLFYELSLIYNVEDSYYIFLDYNCRNKLYEVYLDLLQKIKTEYNNPDNVHIIPIPCIEYIVLDMLHKYEYCDHIWLQDVLGFNREIIKGIKGTGLEGKLKNYLDSLGEEYVNYNLNPDEKKGINVIDNEGLFYIEDDGMPSMKAERLYTMLPLSDDLIYVDDTYVNILLKFDIQNKMLTIDELNNERCSFFDNMSDSLGYARKRITIFCN